MKVAESLYESLRQKDILVYLNNPQVMGVVFDLGWEGGIKNVKCQISSSKCLEDYLFIVEANVGVNKANYFVERVLSEEMKVESDGRIRKSLKISYQVLVPQGSELEKVLIDSQELDKEKIDTSNISQKTSFGILVNIPVGEKREVEIHWFLPGRIEFSEKVQYLYFIQKQSGVWPEKFNLKVFPLSEMVVVPVWPMAKFENGNYLFTSEFSFDLPFEFYFLR